MSAGVSHRGRVNAGHFPELPLSSPETAEPEHGALEAVRERGLQRGAVDEMRPGDRHSFLSPRQRTVFCRHPCFVEHELPPDGDSNPFPYSCNITKISTAIRASKTNAAIFHGLFG